MKFVARAVLHRRQKACSRGPDRKTPRSNSGAVAQHRRLAVRQPAASGRGFPRAIAAKRRCGVGRKRQIAGQDGLHRDEGLRHVASLAEKIEPAPHTRSAAPARKRFMREREIARASAHAARIAPSRRARRAAHGGTRRGLKPPPARRMQKRHMPRSAIHGAPIVAPPRPLRRPHPGHARRPFTRRPRMRLRMRSNAHGRACATRRRPARRAIATNRESARRGLPRPLEFDCTDRGCATESKFLEMSAQPARRARSTMQARARNDTRPRL